jgi:plasmid maintenance system antidote protein VapI
MAFTRKMLKAMGIEEEKIDQIIEAHTDVTDALKYERDKYKTDAEKLTSVQKELNDLKDEIAKNGDEEWKSKYDKVQKEFDDYKKADKEKAELAKKTDAYKSLLVEVGISAKRIDQILKLSADTVKGIGFDENGKVKDADALKESIKKEWDGFISKEGEKGANVSTPPANNGGATLTRADIYKKDEKGRYVMSTKERQDALVKLKQTEQKGQ